MKIKTWLAASLLVFTSQALLFGQNIDPKLAAALQHTLDSMRTVLNVKSLSAALQLPDGNTWAGAKGISSVSPLDSATASHTYCIGSVTKTLTAGCIMQLADEAALSLDDSLHRWLDTFQYISPNITIRQLLRHQSGIYDVITAPAYQPYMLSNYSTFYDSEFAVVNFIQPPLFQPGNGWSYSNTNYLLLGMIIEKVTGNTYHQETRDRFLTPLGMTSTALIPFEPLTGQIAHGWFDLNGDGVSDDGHDFFINWNSFHSTAGPAGAHFATATDMAVWMRAYMGGSLLSPAMMEQMQTTVNTPFPGGTKYGLGMMERNFIGYKGYGHGGDIIYSASVFYFPEKDVSIAVLNNDSKNNSWTLAPVITALLKTYIECESMINATESREMPVVQVSVYPNPFVENVSVKIETPYPVQSLRFSILDLHGREVYSTVKTVTGTGAEVFEFEGFGQYPEGAYVLRVLPDGKPGTGVLLMKGG